LDHGRRPRRAALTALTATLLLAPVLPALAAPRSAAAVVSGELKVWHRVTLTFDGPKASEDGATNPFLDYRLTVAFSNGVRSYVVPGFFAADGNAADTGATSGRSFRVHFAPDAPGTWRWTAFFRSGPASRFPTARRRHTAPPDGTTGTFEVLPSDKQGRDHRAKGRLDYGGERYLRFAGTGEYFLKGGADSPENFLAYADFDGGGRHRYAPHLPDFRQGDPSWRDGRGRGIVGALNYLASQG
jgi:hypothetical protein